MEIEHTTRFPMDYPFSCIGDTANPEKAKSPTLPSFETSLSKGTPRVKCNLNSPVPQSGAIRSPSCLDPPRRSRLDGEMRRAHRPAPHSPPAPSPRNNRWSRAAALSAGLASGLCLRVQDAGGRGRDRRTRGKEDEGRSHLPASESTPALGVGARPLRPSPYSRTQSAGGRAGRARRQ